jgi:hypothetical protein
LVPGNAAVGRRKPAMAECESGVVGENGRHLFVVTQVVAASSGSLAT